MANRINVFFFLVLIIFCIGCAKNSEQNSGIQYFRLEGLKRFVQTTATNPPLVYLHQKLTKDAQLAPAPECGLGTLEDLTGAARLYLRHFEMSGDTTSRRQAQVLLHTVLLLQKPDGLFFNWIAADAQPVSCNNDNVDQFGYPEVQALWALAAGIKNFEQYDPAFAQKMHASFWRSFAHVDSGLSHYGNFYEKAGMKFPEWLPFRSSADAASQLVLASAALAPSALNDAQQTQRLEKAMQQLAEGIQQMQAGNAEQFPHGAHLAFETYWHSWGNYAMQALALAGARFNRQDFLTSALDEADHFVPYLQQNQFVHRFNLLETQTNPNRMDYFPQTAADIHPLIAGLLELSHVTGNRRYARRAGEIARWFRGDNKAHEAVYIAKLGLAHDFVQGHNNVPSTFTAAATVESLLALLAVENSADARSEFYAKIENVLEGKP